MFKDLHPDLRHHIRNSLGWTSLRDVQKAAIPPIQQGKNAVLLAPTAGGKTEAAFFPIISTLMEERWDGMSVLYLSPIRALLNNQLPRLEQLFGLVGYRAATWHGDVKQSEKRRIREEPPNALLTTPESLEAMLISTKTSGSGMFGDLRAVVIDEVHAFADDDRGWHLLGVLNRLQNYAGRDLQRIGLSATVGNPTEIGTWLSSNSEREVSVIDPPPPEDAPEPEVELDWVGSIANAAKIIDLAHKGERRLAFCDSRLQAEKLARKLKDRGVTTYLNHSSLSRDERRRTERAFAEGGPAVIVATSALELGIDIGDLDRIIQLEAPYSVASFLQRMGRTGRRPGKRSNMLFLATTTSGLLRGAALLDLWKRGFVESARAPREPTHILAQQLLALTLERPGLGRDSLLNGVQPFVDAAGLQPTDAREVFEHLVEAGYLFLDGQRVGIGRQGEEEFGQRHFLSLVSVFTSPPLFRVVHKNREIGTVHQTTFTNRAQGERAVILLAGRSWLVTSLDWDRRVAHVEPFDMQGKSTWLSAGQAMSPELAEAHRRVLCDDERGEDHRSERAANKLEHAKEDHRFLNPEHVTVVRGIDDWDIYTFAGGRANSYVADRLAELDMGRTTATGLRVRLQKNADPDDLRSALRQVHQSSKLPEIPEDHPMVRDLKFSEILPTAQRQRAAVARIYGDAIEECPPLIDADWKVDD